MLGTIDFISGMTNDSSYISFLGYTESNWGQKLKLLYKSIMEFNVYPKQHTLV